MKATLLVFWALVTIASAQSLLQSLPGCAQECAAQYVPASSCELSDVDCMCRSSTLISDLSKCVEQNCTIRDALIATNATKTACHSPSRDHSATITALAPAMAAVSFAFIVIRVIARWNMLGWDDCFISLAWLTGLVVSVLNMVMASHGLGKDIWLVKFDDISDILFLVYVTELFYLASTVLTKIGLSLFLTRIFPFRSFKIAIWTTIGVSSVTGGAFAIAVVFQCTPIPYAWHFWDGETSGSCINRNAGTWAQSGINIAIDLAILLLPVIQLYRLQTSYTMRKKIQISLMFSVGLIVTIVSILRLRSLITFMKSHNLTWDNLACGEWSVVEIHVGIICACMPAARVFFGRVVPKLLGITTTDSRHTAAAYVERNARVGVPQRSWNGMTTMSNAQERFGPTKNSQDFVRLDEIRSERGSVAPLTENAQV